MINIFVFVAAPLYGLIFTTTYQPLVGQFSSNFMFLYLYLILLNLGAALGIIFINIYSLKLQFLNFLSRIDIMIMLMQSLTFFAYLDNSRIKFIFFLIKKITLGAAVGINFYLALIIIKKKFTLFNDFSQMTIRMYIFFGIGFLIGIFVNDLMIKFNFYLPLLSIYSFFRLIYLKLYVKKEILQPNQESPLAMSRKISHSIINDIHRQQVNAFQSRNSMIAKLFSIGQIKFLIGYYLITIASEITPNLQFSIISILVYPKLNWLFALFQLFGTIFVYLIIRKIQNKLKYYLLMALAISIVCFLIGFFLDHPKKIVYLIYVYMFLYGASLGPFFYIFVGYRYSRIGFSICYTNKWLIYALSAVLNSISQKKLQIIITTSILIAIVIILYLLLKDEQLKEIQQQKQFEKLQSKTQEQSLPDDSEMRESNIVELE